MLSPRQTCWAERLSRFQFTWEYRPGRVNVADPLSRHPSFTAEKDNVDKQSLTAEKATTDKQSVQQISTHPKFCENTVLATVITTHLSQLSLSSVTDADIEAENAEAAAIDNNMLSQIVQGYETDPWFTIYVRLNKLRNSENIPDKLCVVHTAVSGHVSGQTGRLTVSLLQDLRSPRLMIAMQGAQLTKANYAK